MKKKLLVLGAVMIMTLSGCGSNADDHENHSNSQDHQHDEMNHSSSGEVPKDLQIAENPTYKVGSQAVLNADHMKGMNGATATIVGAYNTVVYAVSYVPTTGGLKVTNHKWVIQEEIEHAGSTMLKPGTKVILKAEHMQGMEGAEATIDTAEKTTVYMVDYTSTTSGESVKNHQWVTESELSR